MYRQLIKVIKFFKKLKYKRVKALFKTIYFKNIFKLSKWLTNDPYNPVRNIGDKKVVFIHINKNAGTSISNILGIRAKNHSTIKDVINHHLVDQNSYKELFLITCVRNPWDRALSQYFYRVRTNQCNMKTNSINFKDWVKRVYGKNKDEYYINSPKMFLTQVEWLKDFNEEIHIDKIMRFENLECDFNEVSKILGIRKKLPHYNSALNKNYRKYYDLETRKIIEDYFESDIKLFKYKF